MKSGVVGYFMNSENSDNSWGAHLEFMAGGKLVTFPGRLFEWPTAFCNRILALEGTQNFLGSHISKDFWFTFENTLGRGYQPALTKFRDLLRNHNRRRVLSRYYQIHLNIIDIIDKAEAEIAE